MISLDLKDAPVPDLSDVPEVHDPTNTCATCGVPGYGAGPCACCNRLTCYTCARAEPREGFEGRFWFCPACSKAKAEPKAVIRHYGDPRKTRKIVLEDTPS